MYEKYENVVNSLRYCAENDCSTKCPRSGIGKGCIAGLKREAADAIEELQKRVPKRPHGRLIDADALIEDLKYDVDLDAVTLNSKEIVGNVRREIQDDKDFKQKCIFWIEHTPTAIEEEEGE